MLPSVLLFVLGLGAVTSSVAASPSYQSRAESWEQLRKTKRASVLTDPSSLSGQTFDYVIVGGGTAGLVIASRLSENSSLRIAVIEAGADPSSDGSATTGLLAPAQAYWAGLASLTSDYDWHYETVNQTNLNGREIYWPRGKILGGSSAVNGLYMTPSSRLEHDSWANMIGGSAKWTWDRIYPFHRKSENYTAPLQANIDLAGVVVNASAHGTDGPIHVSYPGWFYPQVASWVPTFAALGVETRDPAGGDTWGAYISTSAIDPTSWSRSYATTGYLNGVAGSRSNLVVLTGYQATRINFDGTAATGVSFAASATGTVYNVTASQEVILSAGVIGSPQLLQLSGVGDTTLLTSLGITTVVDLPGVGWHLSDHLSGALVYGGSDTLTTTGDLVLNNASYAAEQLALWQAGDPSSLFNSPNDAIAYVNLTTMIGAEAAATLISSIKAGQSAAVQAYSTNPFVQAGYNLSLTAEVDDFYSSPLGHAEILMSNTGTYGAYGDSLTVSMQAAIQHPLSRGSVQINSASAFDLPTLDPGYLTHPADIQVLRECFKFARTAATTAPLSSYFSSELNPGTDVNTDDEWDAYIRNSVSTEYHPAGSCSMIPQELGGVVDEDMRVYGTSRLRVIDSSIVPTGFSAHMTLPLYGIAENAYDILMGGGTTPTTPAVDESTSTVTQTQTGSSAAPTSTTSTGAAPSSSAPTFVLLALSALASLLF